MIKYIGGKKHTFPEGHIFGRIGSTAKPDHIGNGWRQHEDASNPGQGDAVQFVPEEGTDAFALQHGQRKIACNPEHNRHNKNIYRNDERNEGGACLTVNDVPPGERRSHVTQGDMKNNDQENDGGAQIIQEI